LGSDVTWRQIDDEALQAEATKTVEDVDAAMQQFNLSGALDLIFTLVRRGNRYIEAEAPWKQKKPDQEVILWNALELCRVLSHLVEPFLPARAVEMRRQLGREEPAARPRWTSGHAFRVTPGAPLFPRIDEDRRAALLAKWAPRPVADAASQQSVADGN